MKYLLRVMTTIEPSPCHTHESGQEFTHIQMMIEGFDHRSLASDKTEREILGGNPPEWLPEFASSKTHNTKGYEEY